MKEKRSISSLDNSNPAPVIDNKKINDHALYSKAICIDQLLCIAGNYAASLLGANFMRYTLPHSTTVMIWSVSNIFCNLAPFLYKTPTINIVDTLVELSNSTEDSKPDLNMPSTNNDISKDHYKTALQNAEQMDKALCAVPVITGALFLVNVMGLFGPYAPSALALGPFVCTVQHPHYVAEMVKAIGELSNFTEDSRSDFDN